jgi:arsenite-transporting ATPase
VWPAAPAAVAPGLHAARADGAAWFRSGVLAAQERARGPLDAFGAAALTDDELAAPPGTDGPALLPALRAAHAAGRWDLLVVDLPPATEAVRLLALPGQLRRHLDRLLPPDRPAPAAGLRPLLAGLFGVQLPAQGLAEAAARWSVALAAVAGLVTGPGTAVRLVLDPAGDRSAGEVRAARAGLALLGVAVESLVASRLLPEQSPDPWLAALAGRQRAALRETAAACRLPGPPLRVPHLGYAPGPADLPRLADALPPPAPAAAPAPVLEDRRAGDGLPVWRLPLPGAVRDELGLVRSGDELLVTTGPFRRALPLPAGLRPCTVAGAAFDEDTAELAVRFAPAPRRVPGGRNNLGGGTEATEGVP